MKKARILLVFIFILLGFFFILEKSVTEVYPSVSVQKQTQSEYFDVASNSLENSFLLQQLVSTNYYAFNYRVYTPDWNLINITEILNVLHSESSEFIPFQDIDRCIDPYVHLYPFHEFS